MAGELQRHDLRISTADRESVIAHLQACTAEGRLELDEFAERVDRVYAAKTFGDLEPILADLPQRGSQGAPVAAASELELKAMASAVKRRGRWLVPGKLKISAKAGGVRLDMSHAVIPQTLVEVELDAKASGITIVLPRHATAEDHGVQLFASSAKNAAETDPSETGPSPLHFRFSGQLTASSLRVRRVRRFLWWEY
ncbi:hypothetical protein Afil01_53520 [Actinorhabdospora filicis]|uniref:DUF1707 domain-containing protein n=1 Tax=Actinorhabdospora filicis TaxID=1785913 RepID=A0A9W6SPD3_9ACTN|nr:DUF1707 domain-containing protein [Actinorhabdospora filicis]GLZ80545.1 hypothetical protein Afil01_53520 [Actinorhabdospora filicis]